MFSKDSPYGAANGTPVKLLGKAELGVGVVMVVSQGSNDMPNLGQWLATFSTTSGEPQDSLAVLAR